MLRARWAHSIEKTTVTSAASSCEPGSMATDATSAAAIRSIAHGTGGAALEVSTILTTSPTSAPAAAAYCSARARALSIARDAGLSEHGLGILVRERDPAERQLLTDECPARRRGSRRPGRCPAHRHVDVHADAV